MTDSIVPLNKKRIVILGSSPTILKVDRQSNIGYYESDLLEAVEGLKSDVRDMFNLHMSDFEKSYYNLIMNAIKERFGK